MPKSICRVPRNQPIPRNDDPLQRLLRSAIANSEGAVKDWFVALLQGDKASECKQTGTTKR